MSLRPKCHHADRQVPATAGTPQQLASQSPRTQPWPFSQSHVWFSAFRSRTELVVESFFVADDLELPPKFRWAFVQGAALTVQAASGDMPRYHGGMTSMRGDVMWERTPLLIKQSQAFREPCGLAASASPVVWTLRLPVRRCEDPFLAAWPPHLRPRSAAECAAGSWRPTQRR
jgi:hypothetical protein